MPSVVLGQRLHVCIYLFCFHQVIACLMTLLTLTVRGTLLSPTGVIPRLPKSVNVEPREMSSLDIR